MAEVDFLYTLVGIGIGVFLGAILWFIFLWLVNR